MTISENASVFYNGPVKDYQGPDDWDGSATSYRLRVDWDCKPGEMFDRLDSLAAQNDAPKLKSLIIGMWASESDFSSETIIKAIIQHKDRLSGLRAIFLGDITYEENEISWIQNSNVSPLLEAFPKLEVFRVRGGNGLKFSRIAHASLRALVVETGGLPRSVIREICSCDFPHLNHLELWLGSANYGWDGGVEDLQPILDGQRFAELKYLGLRNCEIADHFAPVIVNAPVLKQLEVLDLSGGNLSDAGGQALLNLPKDARPEELILSHHYLTDSLVAKLKKELRPCKINADDPQSPDGDWRSIMVSE